METPDVLRGSGADASVRPAVPADVPAMGAVQSRAWRAAYRDVLPDDVLSTLDAAVLADAWRPAVVSPPSPGHRVLVACSGPTVVGFAAVQPDGELVALLVDPAQQRHGHGSRLLAAAVDLLREDGASMVVAWSPVQDGPRTRFLSSAGLEPDGARRVLALPDGGRLTEMRLAAAL